MGHVLILGGTRDERAAEAAARQEAARAAAVLQIPGMALPFRRPMLPPAKPRVVRFDDLQHAFPSAQAGGTRLVLTQSAYLLQAWLDSLALDDRIVATAERRSFELGAPEALTGRGPWRHFELRDLGASPVTDSNDEVSAAEVSPVERLLSRAYRSASPEERLRLCHEAVLVESASAVVQLALASACREQTDLVGAREALNEAKRLAPDWEAVHFEDGKFWLSVEEMELASAAFQRACELMPSFSAAHSNFGATLGELDQPEAALRAFRQALVSDPDGVTILNNIGVVTRELGRLEESEAALRRVVSLTPDFVFGHYNLGHTLLLSQNYPAAVAAYEEGQRRDSQKNRRQGCRLAVARFANGDPGGAERDLWRFVDQAPAGEREDLLLEAYEIAQAVSQNRPELAANRAFLDRIAAELNQ